MRLGLIMKQILTSTPHFADIKTNLGIKNLEK
jgi:hypothetical protein